MKRAAIAASGLRSGGIRRHGSKAIPLLISLAAPALGACSMSPVETAATSAASAPASKDPVQARKRAVALAKANPREKDCLVRAMYFESNRSSESGLLGVGTVVMNRVESAKYPETICGVVGAPRQFASGVLTRPMTEKTLPKIEAIADDILNGRRNDAVGSAKHFHTAGLRFSYTNMHYVTVAGGNAFYLKGERPERRRIYEEPKYQLASLSSPAPVSTASSAASASSTSFASAPLAFAPQAAAPENPAFESPAVKLVRNAPLPPDRPLDLDLPKRTARAFIAPPKVDRRLAALLPPSPGMRGTIVSE